MGIEKGCGVVTVCKWTQFQETTIINFTLKEPDDFYCQLKAGMLKKKKKIRYVFM